MASRRRRQKPYLPATGRYDLRDASMPPGEALGEPTGTRQRHTRVGAIADPNPPYGRLLATINIRTDLLELEYAHGRITQAAHFEGRALQSMFERASQVGAGNQWNSGDRVDVYEQHEEHIARKFDVSKEITSKFDWIRRLLGEFDCRILRSILGDHMSYGAAAARFGETGDRGARYIAKRFRHALEALANEQAAKGPAK